MKHHLPKPLFPQQYIGVLNDIKPTILKYITPLDMLLLKPQTSYYKTLPITTILSPLSMHLPVSISPQNESQHQIWKYILKHLYDQGKQTILPYKSKSIWHNQNQRKRKDKHAAQIYRNILTKILYLLHRVEACAPMMMFFVYMFDLVDLLPSMLWVNEALLQDCFEKSCGEGAVNVVRYLLGVSKVDPSHRRSYGLRISCYYDRVAVVEMLLKDGRADPLTDESDCLVVACKHGYEDVVKLLLEDGRADPCGNDYASLRGCYKTGHMHIVKCILEDPRVDRLVLRLIAG